MNVFYFTSDLFVNIAATSIISLLENNRHMNDIHFYIADDGICVEKKKQLQELIEKYNRKITYLIMPDPSEAFRFSFKNRYQLGHSYVRMCIGTILPEEVERVLCLDSDTLILDNLEELWNLDMHGNILAGVEDCINLYAYNKKFHISESNIYCNAGVFLVDLKKWRDEKIENKIIDMIYEANGNIFFFEQTLMNRVCQGKILKLHPKYNCYTLFYAFDYENLINWRQPINFYNNSVILEAIERPCILHFTRNFYMWSRPWMKECDHPMTNTYLKYKEMTEWKNLGNDIHSKKEYFRYKLWHKVPMKILVFWASIVYNIIRPRIWWKNE